MNNTREMPAGLTTAHTRLAVLQARTLRGRILFALAIASILTLTFIAGLHTILHGPAGLLLAVPPLGLCWLASVIAEYTELAADEATTLADTLAWDTTGDNQ